MFLNDHQIALVQASFVPVIEYRDDAAALFYDLLYELDPALENLVRNDLYIQGYTFLDSLFVLVSTLDNQTELIVTTETLGRSYAACGVTAADYGMMGQALQAMLQQGLGDAYSEEIEAAWATVYGMITSIALAAAESVSLDSW